MRINQALNDDELKQVLKPALKTAVEYLLNHISEENQYAIMHEVYYGAVGEEGWYNRTGEFANAWEKQVHTGRNLNHTVEGRFYYSPNLMKYNPSQGQHGTPTGAPESEIPNLGYQQDIRPYLAEIIYQGLSGRVFGDGYWTKKRDAWSLLEKRLGKNVLKKIFKEGLESAGLQIKSYGTPWGES